MLLIGPAANPGPGGAVQVIARLNPSGGVDATWGDGGIAVEGPTS